MSVTNAISSIIIIGALLQISAPDPWVIWLSGFAVLITSINIFGGFVTQECSICLKIRIYWYVSRLSLHGATILFILALGGLINKKQQDVATF